MDQSIFEEEAPHPGSHMTMGALFQFPVSPEPTQTILKDADFCSQLSHASSNVQSGSGFERRCHTKKEIANDLLFRQEVHIQSDPKEKLRGDGNPPFVD
ncbi:hypothetical protein O181_008146 [Austropuccinia psidii MF-1]|uniref:Uncharacterized protein n=1 Tax=Austropuccinia psidii MF-1 TaxID=1389203 RepID=A0A9Q3GI92_9BASI|nr:hypothetical protein [Austropuccinia psidii MF-1]